MQSLDARHSDMIRGEGDWRNMQPIIRATFKQLYDQSSKQQKQIADLLEIAVSMKAQLALRPSLDEIKRLIDDQIREVPKPISKSQHAETLQSISELRSELQRKATVQYVDDSLRRKIDKGDALVKHLSSGGSELQQTLRSIVKEETQKLSSIQDMLLRSVTDITRDIGTSKDIRLELSIVSAELQEVTSALAVGAIDPRIEQALRRKADRQELECISSLKADRVTLSAALTTIERALSDHECALTTLRLRPHTTWSGRGPVVEDESDNHFGSSMFAFGHAAGADESGVAIDDNANDGCEIGRRLREGRDGVVLAALWQRSQALERDVSRLRSERRQYQGRIEALEQGLALSAGVAQAEALSIIIEQVQSRLEDAIPVIAQDMGALAERLYALEMSLPKLVTQQSKMSQEAASASASVLSRLCAAESSLSSQAKALVLFESQRKQAQNSADEELRRNVARVDTLECLYEKWRKIEQQHVVGPGIEGGLGAAAVDAKIALLQAEKRKLRSDLESRI